MGWCQLPILDLCDDAIEHMNSVQFYLELLGIRVEITVQSLQKSNFSGCD
jgi:hypothetical protein